MRSDPRSRTRWRRRALLAGGAVLLCACLDPIQQDTLTPPDPARLTTFSGKVTDSCTGAPLDKVRVLACPGGICLPETQLAKDTDPRGEFLFKDLGPGRLRVSASRADYRASDWIYVLTGEPHPSVELPLPPIVTTPPSTVALDVLFVIDNSLSMEQEQSALASSFSQFLGTLTGYSVNVGLPLRLDLHVGVVSTDMGAGPWALPSCEAPNGDDGKLQSMPRLPGCTPPDDRFISATTSGGVVLTSNVRQGQSCASGCSPSDQVADAFSCIARLGAGGCGFEQPLAALLRALEPATTPGFLRPQSALAVIVLSDEDDCSAVDPKQLFDPAREELGPLTSYRCFRAGITCDEDVGVPGVKQSCKPAHQHLLDLQAVADRLKSLRPGRLYLAVIGGRHESVEVTLEGSNLTLRPSCQYSGGTAVPAIRLSHLVGLLWPNSSFDSICASDLGYTLSSIATRIVTTTLLNPCNL
jgi:hypothetical protein